ncbi:hypothetical protein EXA21_14315 [Vibrio cincinnatiensis]|nr:hypothetical protein [Vibrio cincinnatiensis]MCG3763990.1 hypothetical protein [Vibrio cincinnatiensis]
MQEYLKSIREMVYHERTYTGSQTSKFSEKTRPARRVFSHLSNRLSLQFLDRNREKAIFFLAKTSKMLIKQPEYTYILRKKYVYYM